MKAFVCSDIKSIYLSKEGLDGSEDGTQISEGGLSLPTALRFQDLHVHLYGHGSQFIL